MKRTTHILAIAGVVAVAALAVMAFGATQADAETINVPSDYSAIQQAIDNATSDDTIDIASGYTHDGTRIIVDKDLTIEGNNAVIDAGIDIESGADVVINNLTIQDLSTADTSSWSGLSTAGSEWIVVGVRSGTLTATNLDITQTNTLSAQYVNLVGISVQNGEEMTLNDSTFDLTNVNYSLTYGVYAQQGATGVSLNDNTFNLWSERRTMFIGTEFYATGEQVPIQMTNNVFNAAGSDFGYWLQVFSGSSITREMVNNYIDGNLTAGRISHVYLGGWYDYISGGPCDAIIYDGQSIQTAIDEASPGHTICVAAGTYTENIVIPKPLVLKGPNAGIDPNTGNRVAEANITAKITVDANDVSILGFNISDSTAMDFYNGNLDNLTISWNYIIGMNDGIQVNYFEWSGTSYDSHNVTISHNYIGDMTGTATRSPFYIGGLVSSDISYNTFSNTLWGGIQLAGCSDLDFTYNRFVNITEKKSYWVQFTKDNENVRILYNTGINTTGGVKLYGNDQTDYHIDFEIAHNTFNSLVPPDSGTGSHQEPHITVWDFYGAYADGLDIHDNKINQELDNLIAGTSSTSAMAFFGVLDDITVQNNNLTVTGSLASASNYYGMYIRGGPKSYTIQGNSFIGSSADGTMGIKLAINEHPAYTGYASDGTTVLIPWSPSDTDIQITQNAFDAFDYGLKFFRNYPQEDGLVAGATVDVNYNTIQNSVTAGISNAGGQQIVDATYNWWGHPSGPNHTSNPSKDNGMGDNVSDNVHFSPWLNAPYPGGKAIDYWNPISVDGEADINEKANADTTVNITTTEEQNVTVQNYVGDPQPGAGSPQGIGPIGKYVNVSVENETAVEWPVNITIYYTQADLDAAGIPETMLAAMLYYNETSGDWEAYNDTGVNTTYSEDGYEGYVWANAWNSDQLSPKAQSGFTDVWVDDDQDPSWYDTRHVRTIQEGIGNVTEGGTVHVWDGLYRGTNILVDKSVDIIGNTSVDALNGAVSYNTNVTYTDKGFVVEADYVNITGFNLAYWGMNPAPCGGVLVNHSSHCNISGNIIQDDADGIKLNHSDDNIVYNNIISGQSDFGIWLVDAASNVIEANNITDNSFGIYYETSEPVPASWNTIVANNISSNDYWGIYMEDTDNETIMYNWFYGNGITEGGAVYFWDVENSTVAENEMYGNLEGIVLENCYNVTVESNIIIGLSIPDDGGETYTVSVNTGEGWEVCEELRFPRYYRTEHVRLPSSTGDTYRVRIEQHGGIAAHVDYVALGRGALHTPDQAIVHGDGTSVMDKLLARDNDVASAWEQTIELTWNERFTEPVLVMVANEEQPMEMEIPLRTPSVMTPDNMEPYTLQNNGAIEVDGTPDGLGEADFSDFWMPMSGHPWGDTQVWLRSDGEYLYGVMDITSDNTWDDTGWASLYVAVGDEVQEFRVDTDDQTYGTPGFVYTDAVAWQHVYYEFKIPLADIEASLGDTIRVGYGSYGTSAQIIGSTGVRISGGRTNNTVRGNVLEEHAHAIALQWVDNETIEDNILYNNSYGIWVEMCRDVNVTGNIIDNAPGWGEEGIHVADIGMMVGYPVDEYCYNNVSDNVVMNCSYGIYLQYTDNETVADNILYNNTYGILLEGCRDIDVTGNLVDNPPMWGEFGIVVTDMYLNGDTAPERCFNNLSYNMVANSSYGIALVSTDNETVYANTVTNCTSYGIALDAVRDSLIWDNVLTANGYSSMYISPASGIMLYDCYNVTVLSNDINGSFVGDNAGISIIGMSEGGGSVEGSYNTIVDNTIWQCFGAIALFGTDHETLEGNTMYDNGQYGIYIAASYDSVIANCTVSDTAGYDFWSDSPSYNNTVANLTVSSYPTSVDFTYGNGIALKGVEHAELHPNPGYADIGKFLNITNVTATSWINISIHYEEDDLDQTDEDTLMLHRLNDTSWELANPDYEMVNTADNYLRANLSEFSIFGVFGDFTRYWMNLSEGWNMVTLPVWNSSFVNAQDLGEWIPDCTMVSRWNPQEQMYVTHVVGYGSGFNLVNGSGYFVYVTADVSKEYTGMGQAMVNLTVMDGYNLLGWTQTIDTNASALLASIENCLKLGMYDPSLGWLPQYFAGSPAPLNFEVVAGDGVFVYVTTGSSTWNGS